MPGRKAKAAPPVLEAKAPPPGIPKAKAPPPVLEPWQENPLGGIYRRPAPPPQVLEPPQESEPVAELSPEAFDVASPADGIWTVNGRDPDYRPDGRRLVERETPRDEFEEQVGNAEPQSSDELREQIADIIVNGRDPGYVPDERDTDIGEDDSEPARRDELAVSYPGQDKPPSEQDPVLRGFAVNGRDRNHDLDTSSDEERDERRRLRSRSRDASPTEERTEEPTEAVDSRWLTTLASQLRAGARIALTEAQAQTVENEFPADWLDGAEPSSAAEVDTNEAPQSSEPRPASPAADAAPEAAVEDPMMVELSSE